MKEQDTSLLEQIHQLDIVAEQKAKLLQIVKVEQKALRVMEFKLERTLKDKKIATNLLNASITALEQKQMYISKTNEELSKRKADIEAKNIELRKQKLVVDRQARQLKKHLEYIESSYKEMEQFTYIASHDLQSPLRTISNFAQLLGSRYKDQLDQQANDFIDFILQGTQNMSNVIRDLLQFSRVGKDEEQMKRTDLKVVLEQAQLNLLDEITKQDVSLVVGDLPRIYSHSSSLVQLFQNLIGNAIKFRSTRQPKIEISCEPTEDAWIFYIVDNGIGIDQQLHDKAFQPFQRGGHQDRPGTGIGLAICDKIVKMHKGSIRFESELGKGTRFIIHFPKRMEKKIQSCSLDVAQK